MEEGYTAWQPLELAYNELLEAERAYSNAINRVYNALSNDDRVRNHPSTKESKENLMSFHSVSDWLNFVRKFEYIMRNEGVDLDNIDFYK
jgi:hypothetical protein